MDDNTVVACRKALSLCNYMLHTHEDPYVRQEMRRIEFFLEHHQSQASAEHAIEVSRYIERNFDNVVGQNVVIDIVELLDLNRV